MEVTLTQMLDARESRASLQKQLLQRYRKPLICFTMNIAGPVKHSAPIEQAYRLGKRLLLARLSHILHFEQRISVTGCEGFYVVDADPLALKQLCAAIEDSAPVCRLFDMDVLDTQGRKLSREQLGLPARTCLICGGPVYQCSRSRAHSVSQLQEKTARLLQTADSATFLASLAYQALVQEVRTTPKPGLVDEENNGSHRDMDLPLFLKSAQALQAYFYEAAKAPGFAALRAAGLTAEQAMYRATGGVNTHKGAIFTMGLLCAGAAMGDDVLKNCAALTQGLCDRDFQGITPATARTWGQRLYAAYGITGIRGQAQQGFPAVGYVGLPVLEAGLARGLSLNDAGCAALLHILCATQDTNLIARSSLETAQGITRHVAALLEDSPYPSRETLEALDARFIRQNLSPGGSADLLAATYFLHFWNNSQRRRAEKE